MEQEGGKSAFEVERAAADGTVTTVAVDPATGQLGPAAADDGKNGDDEDRKGSEHGENDDAD